MPVEFQRRFRSFLLSRSGLQILGITAGGKAILFAKPRQRVVRPTEGSGGGARGSGPFGRGNGLYLLDLETETETLIASQSGTQLARGGELIVGLGVFDSNNRQARGLRAWDAATGELREDWQVELDLQAGRNRFEVDPHGRSVLISRSDLLIQATGGSTIQFIDVTAPSGTPRRSRSRAMSKTWH